MAKEKRGYRGKVFSHLRKIHEGNMRNCVLLLLFVVFLVGGCVSTTRQMSESECRYASWYDLGLRDATLGQPWTLFNNYVSACSRYGVHPDRDAYMRGWKEGIKIYCTYEHGFEEGRLGKTYMYVCPPNLETNFMRGYQKGREIGRIERRIDALERRRERIEREIAEKEDRLFSSGISDKERRRLRRELQDLDYEYRRIESELRFLIRKLYNQ